jgi:SAM-dependent methyltransferase/uncharacterized protein YbaR (Trm112 family)
MKRRLAELLVCPVDRGALELVALEEARTPLEEADRKRALELGIDPVLLETEVSDGVLLNPRLKLAYAVLNGVPRMLVFANGATAEFRRKFAAELDARAPGYAFPELPSAEGERDVLRSFSAEWTNYDWKGDAYWNLTPDAWFRCMREVLDTASQPLTAKRVLEVGIGIGATANHLAQRDGCELVGVDLGFAVDAAHRHFGSNPFLHIVQASAFAPPFTEESFDFVYSFGVIHHTYSTKAAFDQVSRLPKHGGRLYIWVYSPYDEARSPVRRVLMTLENGTRPWIARLPDPMQTVALTPFVPLYMGYQALRKLTSKNGAQILYGPREAMHAARDRFAPRYIHRHSEDEVRAWFRSAGYGELVAGSERPHPDFVPEAFWACTGVEGRRR